MLDTSSKGQIGLPELEKANLVCGAGLTKREMVDIIDYVKINFKGKLDLNTALKMLQRMPDPVEDDF